MYISNSLSTITSTNTIAITTITNTNGNGPKSLWFVEELEWVIFGEEIVTHLYITAAGFAAHSLPSSLKTSIN